jgi:hypothetical protein
MRIRHCGLRTNRHKHLLEKARQLLGRLKKTPLSQRSTRGLMLQLTGIDISRCPRCHPGTLVFLAKLNPKPLDSS